MQLIGVDQCSRNILNFHHRTSKVNCPSPSLSIPDQVEKLETDLIGKALIESGGNKSQAARLLNLTRQGLAQKMKRYGITPR